jgi:hypothetical protein
MLKILWIISLLIVSNQIFAKSKCEREWEALEYVQSQLRNRGAEPLIIKEHQKCRKGKNNNLKETYAKTATSGTITFDYSNNNGRYFIGNGIKRFEVDFSGASNSSIHIYKDPKSIKKIALAYENYDFSEIGDAKRLDYSSRARTPKINEIVILVNQSNYYAAIKIIKVESRSHGKKRDKVTFSYLILNNKSSIFR